MMTFETTFSLYLLLICNGAIAAAAAIAILRLQRMTDQHKSFWDSPNGSALNSQNGQEELIRAIDQRFSVLLNGIDQLTRDDNVDTRATPALPLENAVRMAKHGATLGDLTRNCGLSKTEARLLIRVHGHPQTSTEVH